MHSKYISFYAPQFLKLAHSGITAKKAEVQNIGKRWTNFHRGLGEGRRK